MKIDLHADAPFSIEQDISSLYNLYIQITHTYGVYLFVGLVLIVVLYLSGFTCKRSSTSPLISEEESRRVNEERMRRVRRMQVGDVYDSDVRTM
ncbi:hypothetical protein WA171_003331 [Blastocystis sp. BT1]